MKKPVYLALSILDLSETVMYEFWLDYVNPKYGENAKLCYIDTDSFIVQVKTDDIYKDIAYLLKQNLTLQIFKETEHYLKEKNKKVIELMKDELGGKIMKEFVGLRTKTYIYLKDNNDEEKKVKGTKNFIIKKN